MGSITLLVTLAAIMFLSAVLLGICAYRTKEKSKQGFLIILIITALLIAGISFGDAIVRMDELEGNQHQFFKIEPPFSPDPKLDEQNAEN